MGCGKIKDMDLTGGYFNIKAPSAPFKRVIVTMQQIDRGSWLQSYGLTDWKDWCLRVIMWAEGQPLAWEGNKFNSRSVIYLRDYICKPLKVEFLNLTRLD